MSTVMAFTTGIWDAVRRTTEEALEGILPSTKPTPRPAAGTNAPARSAGGTNAAPANAAPANAAPANTASPGSAATARRRVSVDPARAAMRRAIENRFEAAASPFPARAANAETGSAFMTRIKGLKPAQREAAILAEIEAGNVPDFLRKMKTVEFKSRGRDGKLRTAKLKVMPDYLAIGSNSDHVRVPMTPQTAQKLADRFGMSLPTRKIVDQVHAQATVKVTPRALSKDREQTKTFGQHDAIIQGQLSGKPQGELTSGHKKDVVISDRLATRPDRVAIYGWHQSNGKPIQPLSTVHHKDYVDYSHGVRLVSGTVDIDGVKRPLAEVLADPNLAPLLSAEGPITTSRYPTD
jgi:hypothetical protein